MKTVIIVGMAGPYTDHPGNAEVWGCNRTFEHQQNLTRLYFFDDPEWMYPDDPTGDRFVHAVNGLGIPVVSRKHYPRIPASEPYPIDEVIRFFGVNYFTSTIPYMLADAIRLGFEKIVMHKINCFGQAMDYFHQKSCLDFWCGVALGRGVAVSISEDSHLCKPYPWMGSAYGYEWSSVSEIAGRTLASAANAILRLPVSFSEPIERKDVQRKH